MAWRSPRLDGQHVDRRIGQQVHRDAAEHGVGNTAAAMRADRDHIWFELLDLLPETSLLIGTAAI